MLKRLTKIGSSKGIIIDKVLLELTGIRDEIEIEVVGKALIIKPADHEAAQDSDLRALNEMLMEIHKKTLKKLAK